MGTLAPISTLLSTGAGLGYKLYQDQEKKVAERKAKAEQNKRTKATIALRDRQLEKEISAIEKKAEKERAQAVVGYASSGIRPGWGSPARRVSLIDRQKSDLTTGAREEEALARQASGLASSSTASSSSSGNNYLLRALLRAFARGI